MQFQSNLSSVVSVSSARRHAGLLRRAVCSAAVAVAVLISGNHAARPAIAADQVDKFPEPSVAPISWELTFRNSAPKRIVVQLPGETVPAAYWYITYTVINLGAKEQNFDPDFSMVAADGKEYKGNQAISTSVFDAIKRRENNQLLISPRKIIGLINVGKELARDGVAIWKEPLRKMDVFSIFVGGLSGETATMKKVGEKWVVVDPTKAGDELKDVKEEDRLLLRKQYQVSYRIIGDENNVGNDPIFKKSEGWVMKP